MLGQSRLEETLLRFSLAHARLHLKSEASRADVKRVIPLVENALQAIGVDAAAGELDTDVIETGTAVSQREIIKTMKGIIEDLEGEYDRGAPVEMVTERAREAGMDRSKAEHGIDKLKQQGSVYEPEENHLRTT